MLLSLNQIQFHFRESCMRPHLQWRQLDSRRIGKQDCADDNDVYRTCRAYDHCIIICRKGELKRKDADTSNGKDYDWVTRRKRL